MNPTLAALVPATPPAAAHGAAARRSADDDAGGDFAGCMDEARGATANQAAAEQQRASRADEAQRRSREADAGDDDGADAESEAGDTATAATPDLSQWLPGWTPPVSGAPAAAVKAAEGSAAAEAIDGATAALATVAARKAGATVVPGEHAGRHAAAADGHAPDGMPVQPQAAATTAATTASPTAAASAEGAGASHATTSRAATAASRDVPGTADLVAPPATTATPAPTAPAHAARPETAVPTAALAPHVETPAFAPALATQVRWWAADGVQQAQLTINPPEMGPVAVKIVVTDGREARIDFTADQAGTRSALEGALPVLAAALDDTGLKLTGGGVHDGAAQRQSHWQQASQQAGGGSSVTHRTDAGPSDALTAAAAVATRHGVARGLVDLLA